MQSNALSTAARALSLVERPRRSPRRLALQQAVERCLAELARWARRRRGRAVLATLDDRMLKDIGITRADAWQEINKPFWRK